MSRHDLSPVVAVRVGWVIDLQKQSKFWLSLDVRVSSIVRMAQSSAEQSVNYINLSGANVDKAYGYADSTVCIRIQREDSVWYLLPEEIQDFDLWLAAFMIASHYDDSNDYPFDSPLAIDPPSSTSLPSSKADSTPMSEMGYSWKKKCNIASVNPRVPARLRCMTNLRVYATCTRLYVIGTLPNKYTEASIATIRTPDSGFSGTETLGSSFLPKVRGDHDVTGSLMPQYRILQFDRTVPDPPSLSSIMYEHKKIYDEGGIESFLRRLMSGQSVDEYNDSSSDIAMLLKSAPLNQSSHPAKSFTHQGDKRQGTDLLTSNHANSDQKPRSDSLHYSKEADSESGSLRSTSKGSKRSPTFELVEFSAFGLVGAITFTKGYHLIFVTEVEQVGTIGNHEVMTIRGTEMVPVYYEQESSQKSSKLLSKLQSVFSQSDHESTIESRYQSLFLSFDMSKDFFFSYTYDLTRPLQQQVVADVNVSNVDTSSNDSQSLGANRTVSIEVAPQDMFVWNSYLLSELSEKPFGEEGIVSIPEYHSLQNGTPITSATHTSTAAAHPQPFNGLAHAPISNAWSLPLIHGFFKQVSFVSSGVSCLLTLLARRSRHYAGTRYQKRGANEFGFVGNEVESEQIVDDCMGGLSSFVQLRGSIPSYWSQKTSAAVPKPPIVIAPRDTSFSAARHHFAGCFSRYGAPLLALNVVKKKERYARESLIGNEYAKAVAALNRELPNDLRIQYLSLDYSQLVRSKKHNVLAALRDVSRWAISHTGFFAVSAVQPIADSVALQSEHWKNAPVIHPSHFSFGYSPEQAEKIVAEANRERSSKIAVVNTFPSLINKNVPKSRRRSGRIATTDTREPHSDSTRRLLSSPPDASQKMLDFCGLNLPIEFFHFCDIYNASLGNRRDQCIDNMHSRARSMSPKTNFPYKPGMDPSELNINTYTGIHRNGSGEVYSNRSVSDNDDRFTHLPDSAHSIPYLQSLAAAQDIPVVRVLSNQEVQWTVDSLKSGKLNATTSQYSTQLLGSNNLPYVTNGSSNNQNTLDDPQSVIGPSTSIKEHILSSKNGELLVHSKASSNNYAKSKIGVSTSDRLLSPLSARVESARDNHSQEALSSDLFDSTSYGQFITSSSGKNMYSPIGDKRNLSTSSTVSASNDIVFRKIPVVPGKTAVDTPSTNSPKDSYSNVKLPRTHCGTSPQGASFHSESSATEFGLAPITKSLGSSTHSFNNSTVFDSSFPNTSALYSVRSYESLDSIQEAPYPDTTTPDANDCSADLSKRENSRSIDGFVAVDYPISDLALPDVAQRPRNLVRAKETFLSSLMAKKPTLSLPTAISRRGKSYTSRTALSARSDAQLADLRLQSMNLQGSLANSAGESDLTQQLLRTRSEVQIQTNLSASTKLRTLGGDFVMKENEQYVHIASVAKHGAEIGASGLTSNALPVLYTDWQHYSKLIEDERPASPVSLENVSIALNHEVEQRNLPKVMTTLIGQTTLSPHTKRLLLNLESEAPQKGSQLTDSASVDNQDLAAALAGTVNYTVGSTESQRYRHVSSSQDQIRGGIAARLRDAEAVGQSGIYLYLDLMGRPHGYHDKRLLTGTPVYPTVNKSAQEVYSDTPPGYDTNFSDPASSVLRSHIFRMQSGVLRTNCIDCLDRTNVAQVAIGSHVLGLQLCALGLSRTESLDPTEPIIAALMELYTLHGDSIAKQYGGSEANKKVTASAHEESVRHGKQADLHDDATGEFTEKYTASLSDDDNAIRKEKSRTLPWMSSSQLTSKIASKNLISGKVGKMKLASSGPGEILTSLQRYYSNSFTDGIKQAAINIFLGIFRPKIHIGSLSVHNPADPMYSPSAVLQHIWELESDVALHRRAQYHSLPFERFSLFCNSLYYSNPGYDWWSVPLKVFMRKGLPTLHGNAIDLFYSLPLSYQKLLLLRSTYPAIPVAPQNPLPFSIVDKSIRNHTSELSHLKQRLNNDVTELTTVGRSSSDFLEEDTACPELLLTSVFPTFFHLTIPSRVDELHVHVQPHSNVPHSKYTSLDSIQSPEVSKKRIYQRIVELGDAYKKILPISSSFGIAAATQSSQHQFDLHTLEPASLYSSDCLTSTPFSNTHTPIVEMQIPTEGTNFTSDPSMHLSSPSVTSSLSTQDPANFRSENAMEIQSPSQPSVLNDSEPRYGSHVTLSPSLVPPASPVYKTDGISAPSTPSLPPLHAPFDLSDHRSPSYQPVPQSTRNSAVSQLLSRSRSLTSKIDLKLKRKFQSPILGIRGAKRVPVHDDALCSSLFADISVSMNGPHSAIRTPANDSLPHNSPSLHMPHNVVAKNEDATQQNAHPLFQKLTTSRPSPSVLVSQNSGRHVRLPNLSTSSQMKNVLEEGKKPFPQGLLSFVDVTKDQSSSMDPPVQRMSINVGDILYPHQDSLRSDDSALHSDGRLSPCLRNSNYMSSIAKREGFGTQRSTLQYLSTAEESIRRQDASQSSTNVTRRVTSLPPLPTHDSTLEEFESYVSLSEIPQAYMRNEYLQMKAQKSLESPLKQSNQLQISGNTSASQSWPAHRQVGMTLSADSENGDTNAGNETTHISAISHVRRNMDENQSSPVESDANSPDIEMPPSSANSRNSPTHFGHVSSIPQVGDHSLTMNVEELEEHILRLRNLHTNSNLGGLLSSTGTDVVQSLQSNGYLHEIGDIATSCSSPLKNVNRDTPFGNTHKDVIPTAATTGGMDPTSRSYSVNLQSEVQEIVTKNESFPHTSDSYDLLSSAALATAKPVETLFVQTFK